MLRNVLLGLLDAEPRYGYELKAVFESFLGGTWPLNPGQVYTTLARLEKDGLVAADVVPQDGLPDRKVFALTDDGRAELGDWFESVDTGPVRLREELFLKIAVRSLTDPAAAAALIASQRAAHLDTLAELQSAGDDAHVAPTTALLLEGAMLRLEADLAWLDLAESRLKGWPEPPP